MRQLKWLIRKRGLLPNSVFSNLASWTSLEVNEGMISAAFADFVFWQPSQLDEIT